MCSEGHELSKLVVHQIARILSMRLARMLYTMSNTQTEDTKKRGNERDGNKEVQQKEEESATEFKKQILSSSKKSS